MESISKIVQSISESEGSSFSKFVGALNEHQSIRLSSAESIGQYITSLLNKTATRKQGLCLLEVYLSQSTLDQISQKGQYWANICIKTCNQKSTDNAISLAYQCLACLMQKSTEIPELSKAFTSHMLGKVVETLTYTGQESNVAALRCLETTLKIFPGTCGVYRNLIEKFVISFIDSTDELLVTLSGKCLHLLQQVKSAANAGINHNTAWQQYHLKIIGSSHELLDVIFTNFAEIYDEEIGSEKLIINPLDLKSEPVQRASQLFIRFKNLIKYLIIALGEPYSVPKPIMPKKVLNLIERGLSVNCLAAEQSQISDNIAMGALLPDVHIQLFKLLDMLILTLKTHLAMYAKLIVRFVVDTLKWTSFGKSEGFQKPYRSLRIAAYNTLLLWCKVMKGGSLCELVSESLIEQIMCDVIPFHAEVTLKMLSGARKHMSKKARRLLHKAENERSHITQMHSKAFNPQHSKKIYSDEGNTLLCVSALKCLRNIISSAFNFLKPTIVRDVQEKMFTLCSQLIEESTQKEKLYWHSECREALYDVIYTLVLWPHHLSAPPTALAITLLEMGQHFDRSQKVRNVCLEHLQSIEKILHPQKECLYFPPDISAIKTAFKNHRKQSIVIEEDSLSANDEVTEIITDEEIETYPITKEVLPSQSDTGAGNAPAQETREGSSKNNEVEKVVESENVSEKECTLLPNVETPIHECEPVDTESIECDASVSINECNTEEAHTEDDVIVLTDDEPVAKRSRLANPSKKANIDEERKANASEEDIIVLDSILTTFVDELNESRSD